MTLTRDYVKNLLGGVVYARSAEYYKYGRVVRFLLNETRGGVSIRSSVKGTFRYEVEIDISNDEDILLCHCGCPAYDAFGRCKHIGATLLEYLDQQKPAVQERPRGMIGADRTSRVINNAGANLLLTKYQNGISSEEAGGIKIVPQLALEYDSIEISFTLGNDRQYVMRDISEFYRSISYSQTVQYGQKLSFRHTRDAFDDESKPLVDFIMATINEQMFYSKSAGSRLSPAVLPTLRSLKLSGRSLDELFDMYSGDEIANRAGGERWKLKDENPSLTVRAENVGDRVRISVSPKAQRVYGAKHDYVAIDRAIYRLTPDYAERMLPMIEAARTDELLFSPKGASDFCLTVLPKIEKHASVDDNGVLDAYRPDRVEICFYIDMPERSTLTARPAFVYQTATYGYDEKNGDGDATKRDSNKEREAVAALIKHFDPPLNAGEQFSINDEERMYAFLSGGMVQLSEYGDIYISDRLKNIHMKKLSRVTVGVSAGDGVLNLNVDTGEFPISELEELMQAVRDKRRYYRLDDGRFLTIGGSELDGLKQMADGLNLTAKDLEKGKLDVPMARALYLDGALKQDGDLTFNRDTSFKKLVRDFKTVDDSDFGVPEPLDEVLRNYQKTGFRWLKTLDAYKFGGILADDMGLGKTLQVLAYLLSVKRERGDDFEGPRASLIVCPASLVLNWGDEVEKWTPELSVCLLCASSAERELEIQARDDYDIMITSYDLMRRDVELHEKASYYACILDEAQYIKNHETKAFHAVKRVKAAVRIALTGTPVENRLSELWSIFDFLMPGYLYNYATFRRQLEAPIAKNGDADARKTLQRLASPFILRRMKKDVLEELPPKIETVNYIQMEDEQRKVYLAHVWDVKKRMESATERDKLEILSMLTRLRQLCCDPSLFIDGYTGESCKLEECARMLDELTESGHEVLVFSQFTSMLSRIRERLDEMHIPSFTLQGDTPREERAELVRRFNAGEAPVFLISLKAGGTGLNLTGADTVIHYDPWWNIAAQNQATDRCYRIGQTRKVQVYQLITKGTIEENILKLQSRKRELAEAVTDSADGGIMSMSRDDIMKLLD